MRRTNVTKVTLMSLQESLAPPVPVEVTCQDARQTRNAQRRPGVKGL